MPTCCDCKNDLPRASFSKAQFKKPISERRCTNCVHIILAVQSNAAAGSDDVEEEKEDRRHQHAPSGSSVKLRPGVGVRCGDALFMGGESCFIGGRTMHLGSSALARGEVFSFSRTNRMERSKRQLDAILSMRKAFSKSDLAKTSLDEAALRLEVSTFRRNSRTPNTTTTQVHIEALNETVIMSTQRWFISALDLEIVQQVITIVRMYRDFMRDFDETLVQKQRFPNSSAVFPTVPRVTKENRPDVITLLNKLFAAPECANVWVFSEPDNEIVCAWLGFELAPNNKALAGLSSNATADEIIRYIHQPNILLEAKTCYWCEASSICDGANLSICTRCRKVSYCSKKCQTYDWKSFHKTECTKDCQVVGNSRFDYLTLSGAQRPAFPSQIAPLHSDSVWRGDILMLYLVNATADTRLGEKTKGFPRGFRVQPREFMGYQ